MQTHHQCISLLSTLAIILAVAFAVRDNFEETVPRAPRIAGSKKIYISTDLRMPENLHSLTCDIQGIPTPRVVWTKDGKELRGPYVANFDIETGKAELIFPSRTFQKAVEGNYTCFATNFVGYDVKTFIISS